MTSAAPTTVPLPVLCAMTSTSFSAHQVAPPEDPYQAGHYPGQLVYPGVFFIESVVHSANQALAATHQSPPLALDAIEHVRFIRPHCPGASYDIVAHYDRAAHGWMLDAQCTYAGEILCQMTLRLCRHTDGQDR